MEERTYFYILMWQFFMQSTWNIEVVLSLEDQVTKAEIICCLDIFDSNETFSATYNDNEKSNFPILQLPKHTLKNLAK